MFQREKRYIVLKLSDMESIPYFGKKYLARAQDLADTVAWFRERGQKIPLECVVVESDWPKFESTWDAIQRRMEGRPTREADLRAEVEQLREENEKLQQGQACDECDPENYGWVFNRVEGRSACTCMIEAEPFQILLAALETISKAATGEIQIADDDTEGMRWIAGKAMEALHSVLPLDYDAPRGAAEAVRG